MMQYEIRSFFLFLVREKYIYIRYVNYLMGSDGERIRSFNFPSIRKVEEGIMVENQNFQDCFCQELKKS